uniref:GPI-anchor transamidase n=1 Tax=Panagrellus redivivus TaxID=6233 RepID=A0A7E4ZXV6_PANRE
MQLLTTILLCSVPFLALTAAPGSVEDQVKGFFDPSTHTNNWAVLVCTSRFWFNYRHVANVLSLYHSIKRLGIPDSNIILMLADNIPCNARNPRPGQINNLPGKATSQNLYGLDVEVDYRGYEVTVDNFIRVLTGRLPEGTPRNKRLLSDHQSNVLVYLSGHGGDGFLKFQDHMELTSGEVAMAVQTMAQNRRYNEILFIVDSCQSASMYSEIYSPNVVSTASSLVGEDSLSYTRDEDIGVYIIDRYAYYAHKFMEDRLNGPDPLQSNVSLADFLTTCNKERCISTVGISTEFYPRATNKVRAADFLGARKYHKNLGSVQYEPSSFWKSVESDNLKPAEEQWKSALYGTALDSVY